MPTDNVAPHRVIGRLFGAMDTLVWDVKAMEEKANEVQD